MEKMTDIKNQIIEINRYIIRQTVDSSLGDPIQSSAIIDITMEQMRHRTSAGKGIIRVLGQLYSHIEENRTGVPSSHLTIQTSEGLKSRVKVPYVKGKTM